MTEDKLKELEKSKELLEKAQFLKRYIEDEKKRIEVLEYMKTQFSEIMICPNINKNKLEKMHYYEKGEQPLYFTGETKNKIIDVIIEKHTNILKENELRYKNLGE